MAETQILQIWDRAAAELAYSAKAGTALPETIRDASTYPVGAVAAVLAATPAAAAISIQIAAALDMSVARAEAMAAAGMVVAVAQAALAALSALSGRARRAHSHQLIRAICNSGA